MLRKNEPFRVRLWQILKFNSHTSEDQEMAFSVVNYVRPNLEDWFWGGRRSEGLKILGSFGEQEL